MRIIAGLHGGVESLRFERCGIFGLEALLENIAKCCPELINFALIKNNVRGISETDSQALALGISMLPNLQVIDLGSNLLGNMGIRFLAPCLIKCSNLIQLILNENDISDFGAQQLAGTLPICVKLSKINLNHNEIANVGCVALAACLGFLPELEEVHLNGNRFGNSGAEALASCIAHCKKLKVLSILANTDVGPLARHKIEDALLAKNSAV